jgi:hypothetical protein
MKTYTVSGRFTIELEHDIKAKNYAEAGRIAEELKPHNFIPESILVTDYGDDLEIGYIAEVK